MQGKPCLFANMLPWPQISANTTPVTRHVRLGAPPQAAMHSFTLVYRLHTTTLGTPASSALDRRKLEEGLDAG